MRGVALSAVFALAATSVFASEDPEDTTAQVTEEAKITLKSTFVPTNIKAPFLEQFTSDWSERWTVSEATKKTPVGTETYSYVGKWEVQEPSQPIISGDLGLVAKTKAAHHAISAPFVNPIDFSSKPLVVQYEVKYQDGGNCGGGYVKLLEDGFQTSGKEFSDNTPWTIMFGPDLTCPGTKLHFIFRHKNPKTGEFEEKHLKVPPAPSIQRDTNLYTLVLHPNNSYDVRFNGESLNSGDLLEDFKPPVNPEKEIDDSEDTKPEEWVDTKMIADPEATKPEDWDEDAPYEVADEEAEKPEGWLEDEPETIPDPDAEKPEEWDDEEDGEWIAPTVRNPKCDDAPGCGEWKRPYKPNPDYKGKWYAPMIDNPDYKGEWAPRKIANPDYFEDLTPVKSLVKIGGIGIELWTMTENILFDNIYVGHSEEEAKKFQSETYDLKHKLEEEAKKVDDKADEDDEEHKTFAEDPMSFIRQKIFAFIDLAKVDPVLAFKSQPETGGALAVAFVTLLGMLLSLIGVIGGQQKPIAKPSKKSDAPTPDDKKTDAASAIPAGGKKADGDSTLKKRTAAK